MNFGGIEMNLFILWTTLAFSNLLYQRFGANVTDYWIALDRSFLQGAALCAVAFSNWILKESK
jgi:hypothetical protein